MAPALRSAAGQGRRRRDAGMRREPPRSAPVASQTCMPGGKEVKAGAGPCLQVWACCSKMKSSLETDVSRNVNCKRRATVS